MKLDLKKAESLLVYNMLQDMRHIIILDFRSKELFDKSHIRKSINVDIGSFEKILIEELTR